MPHRIALLSRLDLIRSMGYCIDERYLHEAFPQTPNRSLNVSTSLTTRVGQTQNNEPLEQHYIGAWPEHCLATPFRVGEQYHDGSDDRGRFDLGSMAEDGCGTSKSCLGCSVKTSDLRRWRKTV